MTRMWQSLFLTFDHCMYWVYGRFYRTGKKS